MRRFLTIAGPVLGLGDAGACPAKGPVSPLSRPTRTNMTPSATAPWLTTDSVELAPRRRRGRRRAWAGLAGWPELRRPRRRKSSSELIPGSGSHRLRHCPDSPTDTEGRTSNGGSEPSTGNCCSRRVRLVGEIRLGTGRHVEQNQRCFEMITSGLTSVLLAILTIPHTAKLRPRLDAMSGRRSGRRRVRRASALLLLPVLSACGTGGQRAAETTTTVAPTTSTTTLQHLDEIIVNRWTEAYNASIAAAKDPSAPALITKLSDYFTGSALSELLSTYSAYVRAGVTSIGDIDLGHPMVVGIPMTTASVHSCWVNRLANIYASTGLPVPGPAGSTSPVLNGIVTTMVLSPSGVWMVSEVTRKDGSCDGI